MENQGQQQEAQGQQQQESQSNGQWNFESLVSKYNNIESQDYSGQQSQGEQQSIPEDQQSNVVGSESNKGQPDRFDQLERIAKLERAAIEREMRAKKIEQEAAEMKAEIEEYRKAKELSKYDKAALLDHLGVDFSELQDQYAQDKAPTSRREAELMKKVGDLENKFKEYMTSIQEKEEKSKAEIQKRREQEQINHYMNSLKKFAEDTKDQDGSLKYELIHGENAYQMVFDRVEQEYQKTGKIMPTDQAMDLVEKDLENILHRVIKYKKFNRIGQVKGDGDNFTAKESFFNQIQQNQESNRNTPNTLNSSFVSSSPPASNRVLDRAESIRRAADLIQFKE